MTKRRSNRQIGVKDLLISLVLIVIVMAAQEFLGLDLSAALTVVEAEPTGALQVYFTGPRFPDQGDRTGGLDTRLAAAIDLAERSVDVAAFDLDLPSVTGALVRADRRGVRVRLVTDTDYEDEWGPTELRRAGIPVVTDQRSAFMHNKFVVIDGQQTWTGSWNLTENGTYRNNTNLVVIHSSKLAANYTSEFEEMFERGEFGPASSDATPHPDIELNGVRIETIFESEGAARDRMITLISEARSSIAFMAFVFTDDDIAEAIIARHRAGLDVAGVIEARNAEGSGSDFGAFEQVGIDILKDGNPYVMHHKVIIVDKSIVITGSYNFSASAANNNDENVLIIHSPQIAATYLDEFDRVYEQAAVAARGD